MVLKIVRTSPRQRSPIEKIICQNNSRRFRQRVRYQIDKSDSVKVDQPREWYLPHHSVVHPHKPGKVRTVLNGAAKFQSQSLNNALKPGPDLVQSFKHILIRYRQQRYADTADIESLFLHVGVIPKDKPPLRFLRREDPASELLSINTTAHLWIQGLTNMCQLRAQGHW